MTVDEPRSHAIRINIPLPPEDRTLLEELTRRAGRLGLMQAAFSQVIRAGLDELDDAEYARLLGGAN